jgi:hypothetical protein
MITLFVLLSRGDRQHCRCRTCLLFGRLNTQSIEALPILSPTTRMDSLALLALLRTRSLGFQPLLYQVAAGILAPGLIAPALRRTVKKQANARTLLAEVYDLDLERKVVVVAREPDGRMLELAWVAWGSAPGSRREPQ